MGTKTLADRTIHFTKILTTSGMQISVQEEGGKPLVEAITVDEVSWYNLNTNDAIDEFCKALGNELKGWLKEEVNK